MCILQGLLHLNSHSFLASQQKEQKVRLQNHAIYLFIIYSFIF